MSTQALSGHVSLVTGASSGIGEGVARALAASGARVVAAARRLDRLTALVSDITAAGGTATALELDVADVASLPAKVALAAGAYGRIDSIVNSAGIMLSAKTADASVADWQRMFETNIFGLMAITHAAFAVMKTQGGGHVVNISSVSAKLANAGSPAYAATKSAVNTFSESLRKEGSACNVRVTVLSPGVVETELFDHASDEATRARFRGMLDSMKALTPADVAAGVVYVLSQPAHVSVSELVLRPTEELD